MEILFHSGAFSILLTHLKIEYDFDDRVGADGEIFSEFKEEKDLDQDQSPEDEEEISLPVGVQIMKLKQEEESDTEEFKEDLFLGVDDENEQIQMFEHDEENDLKKKFNSTQKKHQVNFLRN